MDQSALSASKLAQDQEREKHLRFEKVAEQSTYLVLSGALVLALLPFQFFKFSIDRLPIFAVIFLVLIFSIIWFRFLPKSLIGSVKTLAYFFFSVGFISIGIYLSNGIESFFIFIFYLVILRAAAFVSLRGFIILVIVIASLLFGEAVLFGSLPLVEKLSLWMLHLWALVCVAFFGRYIYNEEKKAEDFGESTKLRTAKQIDIVKNEFVFVVSRKLKDPVATLGQYLQATWQSIDANWTSELKDFLQKTMENTQRLAKLISDLSDLSGIENQKIRLDLRPTVLDQIIGGTLSDFSMRAAEKNITLNYLPSRESLIVTADQSRLHEILANLIDNAIKYSPASSQINISFQRNEKMAQIDIADNGAGIPQEAKAHLFEKFYRVNREGNEAKGTGLGLFVTKELLERQGGKIWFESTLKQGSAFHFTLPLANVVSKVGNG